MLVGVYVAATVVAHSRFAHPFRTLAGLIAGFHLVQFALRWAIWPPKWEAINQSARAATFGLELLTLLFLVGMGTLLLYLYRRLTKPSKVEVINDPTTGTIGLQ
jgi:hypothetical protein